MATPPTDPSFSHGGYDFWIADVGPDKPGIDSEYSQQAAALNLNLRVDWDVRKEARRALLGGTIYIRPPVIQYGYLARVLPHRYTEEEDWLWCTRATIVPEVIRDASGAGVPGACYAIIKARYEALPYQLLEDSDVIGPDFLPNESLLTRYISRPPPVPKDRNIAMRGGGWRFTDRAAAIPLAIGLTVNESEETLIWNQVPLNVVPYATIQSCWGCSNDATFDGRPAGTMVFSSFSFKECPRLTDGTLAVNVHYTFTRKPKGANYFPDPDRGYSYYEVTAFDGSGNKPHPPADLKTLFRPL